MTVMQDMLYEGQLKVSNNVVGNNEAKRKTGGRTFILSS
jgi:hypothetical protein